MKHLINKLSAFLVMLMCMSATVQAEIVHHTVCEPTSSSRGFTQECWENTETGKIYSNANCTQELKDEALAKAVVYARLPESPISNMRDFHESEHENDWSVDFNWAAVTTFENAKTNLYENARYTEFTAKNENISNARLVWNRSHGDVVNGDFTVKIYVNDNLIFTIDQSHYNWVEGVFVQALPGLKQGDVVKYEVKQDAMAASYCVDDPDPTFKACLEYTYCVHEYPEGSCFCTKCGYEKEHIYIHHDACDPSFSTPGYRQECWEDVYTHQFYTDEAHTHELKDVDLAKVVVYAKLPASPVSETSEFIQSEHENDWSVDFNWAAVTTYNNTINNLYEIPRYVKFTVTNEDINNARLVWNRSYGDYRNGRFTVKIYVNGTEKYSINQNYNEDVEGVFVLSLPALKQGDVVKFEVTQNSKAEFENAFPCFKACLEYTTGVCHHEYPANSAICSKCGEIKEHDHNYVNHFCSLCGNVEDGYLLGYVGTDADRKNIRWDLDKNTHVLTFSGSGAMESFNLAHNAWRNEHKTTVTKVVIGEGITSIGDGVYPNGYFIEMSGLTEVVLPSTLKTIGSSGFQDCINLTSITLPEGLETIKANGIRNCKKITSITLPSTLTSIGSTAFADCSGLRDMYIAGSEQITTSNDAFSYINRGNITLHVNGDLYDWAKATSPWSGFNIPRPYNIVYTDAEGVSHEVKFDTNAADNTWTLVDGCKRLVVLENIPMQTLTYTRNFSAANTWQALFVPFEMAYSDWAGKFDVAAISNFHEYTDENGETEKIELEVRYVKNGKLLANIPYLIRAKQAGEQTITLNNVTLKSTESRCIGCSSTERKYTFTGTYDAIDGLQTKDYIFVSGGSLCKASNDTDVLKAMRWYLTIEDYFSVTGNATPALAKPMSIRVVGDGEATGISLLPTSPKSEEMIYNINGVRLSKMQKGINIVGGKKIILR